MNQLQALFYELLYKIVSYLPTLVQGAKKCLVMRTLIVKYQTEMLCMWDFCLNTHKFRRVLYKLFLKFQSVSQRCKLRLAYSFQKPLLPEAAHLPILLSPNRRTGFHVHGGKGWRGYILQQTTIIA